MPSKRGATTSIVIAVLLAGGVGSLFQLQLLGLGHRLETHIERFQERDDKMIEAVQKMTNNQVRICSKVKVAGCKQ